jgi:predicted HAD superfamily Cof-like phosphohydrolase
MPLKQIKTWFEKAVPQPEQKNLNTQMGVHIEEVAEMLETITASTPEMQQKLDDLRRATEEVATDMKTGKMEISITDPVEFADALCDQIVTAVGNGHMAGIEILGAAGEVANSNDSKFDDDGMPIFNPETNKIMKGPRYFKPNLSPFVKQAKFLNS